MVYPRAELSVRVPVSFMGALIGYNGETVRKLQSDTGASIRVQAKAGPCGNGAVVGQNNTGIGIGGGISGGPNSGPGTSSGSNLFASHGIGIGIQGPQSQNNNNSQYGQNHNENLQQLQQLDDDLRQIVISREIEKGITAVFDVCERELNQATRGVLARRRGLNTCGSTVLFAFRVDVASNQIGAVIGRQGRGAQHIRDASRCHTVKIHGEGQVLLIGTLSQIHTAILGVWESIKEIPSVYNVMRVSDNFHKSPLAGPEVSVVLNLPDDTVGMLIGRRGETISSIRRECAGVKIDIESIIKSKQNLVQSGGTSMPSDGISAAAVAGGAVAGTVSASPADESGSGGGQMNDNATAVAGTVSNQQIIPQPGGLQSGQIQSQNSQSNQANQSQTQDLVREVVLRGTMRACCRAHQLITALVENDIRRKTKKAQQNLNSGGIHNNNNQNINNINQNVTNLNSGSVNTGQIQNQVSNQGPNQNIQNQNSNISNHMPSNIMNHQHSTHINNTVTNSMSNNQISNQNQSGQTQIQNLTNNSSNFQNRGSSNIVPNNGQNLSNSGIIPNQMQSTTINTISGINSSQNQNLSKQNLGSNLNTGVVSGQIVTNNQNLSSDQNLSQQCQSQTQSQNRLNQSQSQTQSSQAQTGVSAAQSQVSVQNQTQSQNTSATNSFYSSNNVNTVPGPGQSEPRLSQVNVKDHDVIFNPSNQTVLTAQESNTTSLVANISHTNSSTTGPLDSNTTVTSTTTNSKLNSSNITNSTNSTSNTSSTLNSSMNSSPVATSSPVSETVGLSSMLSHSDPTNVTGINSESNLNLISSNTTSSLDNLNQSIGIQDNISCTQSQLLDETTSLKLSLAQVERTIGVKD